MLAQPEPKCCLRAGAAPLLGPSGVYSSASSLTHGQPRLLVTLEEAAVKQLPLCYLHSSDFVKMKDA